MIRSDMHSKLLPVPHCMVPLVWLRGNTSVSVNAVTLRQVQLLPGRVIILGRVNYLRAEPGIQVNSARAIPPTVGRMSM